MKINRLQITDFQMVKHVDVPLHTPALLICGANEQGKSSIADAIRLALTGESTRVEHKKDWPRLVRVGAQKGAKIVLEGDDWCAALALPSGATKGALPMSEYLYSALDPTWFVRLKPDARRALLFGLMSINAEPDEIIRRIEARGVDADKLKRIAPLIGKGTWESIADDCKKRATKLKGQWEEVTGEAWGLKKADGWIPTIINRPEGTVLGLQQQIDAVDAKIGELNQTIGAHKARAEQVVTLKTRSAELAETAKLHARRTDARMAVEKDLAEGRARLADMKALAEGGVAPQHWPCPECGSVLMHRSADGALVAYSNPEKVADAEARSKLPALEQAITVLERAHSNAVRDVKIAEDAAVQKASIDDQLAALPAAEAIDIDAVRAELSERQDYRRSLVKQQDQIREVESAIAGAAKQRDDAAMHHRDIMQWLEIAELIGPSGIPGDLLSEGLTPFNAKLSELAGIAGWAAPSITNDMSIHVSDLPLGLASESAKYRAVALIALAIAILSGTKFVMLDGAEILVGPQRSALIRLIHQLAAAGDIETAIVIMTLKEPPARLPANWSHVWVEAGEIVRDEAEKVAA